MAVPNLYVPVHVASDGYLPDKVIGILLPIAAPEALIEAAV